MNAIRPVFKFTFLIIFVVTLAAAQLSYAAATVGFKPVKSYLSGGYTAYSVAVADVNHDGIPDMIVADTACYECSAGEISVLLGNSDGTFQAPASYSSDSYFPTSLAIADLNGDNHPDVVVISTCSTEPDPNCTNGGSVSVLLNNGDGTFQPAVAYTSGGYALNKLVVGDVNGDNHPDIVVTVGCDTASTCNGESDGEISVFINKGNGAFRAAVKYDSGGIAPGSVALANLHGGTKPDIIVANGGQCSTCTSGGVVVLANKGNGTFHAPTGYVYSGFVGLLALADVNGDGKPDLVVSNSTCSGCNTGQVSVLLGEGNGEFQSPVTYGSGGIYAGPVALADLNGDGHLDIIVANQCAKADGAGYCGSALGSVGVLAGNGDGTFQTAVKFSSGGYGPLSLAVADVNGDGKPDVLVGNDCEGGSCDANGAKGSVGVLINDFVALTTTKVTSSLSPASVNESVTFTATITSASPVPDGSTVTFYAGTTEIGTGTTTGGIASLTTDFATAHTYTVKATYSGDIFHKASSGTVKQVVSAE